MATIDYKERYENLVEAVKKLQEANPSDEGIQNWVSDNVPELAEPNERIRKSLVAYFAKFKQSDIWDEDFSFGDILAWFEKQSEQKFSDIDNKFIRMRETKPKDISEFLDRLTTVEQEFLWEHIEKIRKLDKEEQGEKNPDDKVKPKFKVGDWVVSPNGVYWHIDDIQNGRYQVSSDSGACAEWPLNTNIYHRFTIQDAKDGDVLATKAASIFIYKELLYGKPFAYCGVDKIGVFKDCNCGNGLDWTPYLSNVIPATKEQRDILFLNMKKSGYEWDDKKKELKKIEQKPVGFNIGDKITVNGQVCRVVAVGKPAEWSEEDESIRKVLFNIIEMYYCGCIEISERDRLLNWLNSLQGRVQPHPQSDERNGLLGKLEEWLDEYVSDLADVETATLICSFTNYLDGKLLKSLRPQNRWKPSDNELEVLRLAAEKDGTCLMGLYEQLKKLREE